MRRLCKRWLYKLHEEFSTVHRQRLEHGLTVGPPRSFSMPHPLKRAREHQQITYTSWAFFDLTEKLRLRKDVNFSSDVDFPVEIPEELDENPADACFSSKLKLTLVAERPSSTKHHKMKTNLWPSAYGLLNITLILFNNNIYKK